MKLTKHLSLNASPINGEYPVIILISHFEIRREIYTGILCKPENWENYSQIIKDTDPLCRYKNESLDACIRRLGGVIQSFIDNVLTNSIDHLICIYKRNDPDMNTPDTMSEQTSDVRLSNLISLKMENSRCLNTKRNYASLKRFCKKHFPEDPGIFDISQEFVDSFFNLLDSKYFDKPAKQFTLKAYFKATLNHAVQEGQLPAKPKLKYPPLFHLSGTRDIHLPDLHKIYHLFTEITHKDPELKKESTLALSLFILDIAFQGLAPVDLSRIRCRDIAFETFEPDDNTNLKKDNPESERISAIIVKTKRRKTSIPVLIITWRDPIEKIVRHFMGNKHPDDYLIPCFNNTDNLTETQIQNRQANWFNKQARELNKILAAEYSLREWGIPPHITFYSARHAFSNLADSLDLPRHLIQILLGHKTSTLERYYIRKLTNYEQALISKKIFLKLSGE